MTINGRYYTEPELAAYVKSLEEHIKELEDYVERNRWRDAEKEKPKPWYVVLIHRSNGVTCFGSMTREGKWLSDYHSQEVKDVMYWKPVQDPKAEEG